MADNVDFTPGSGATGAADEIDDVFYARVKQSLGADGSATDALGGAGAVSAGVQRVTLASDDPLVANVAAGVKTLDGGPNWTTVWGVSSAPFTSADQSASAASVTDTPTSGQKIVVDDVLVSVDTAMTVTFKCETTGTVVAGPFYLPAYATMQITPRGKGWKLATADKKLQVQTSVAGNIMVLASYHSEA